MSSGIETPRYEREAARREGEAIDDIARIASEAGSLKDFLLRVRLGLEKSELMFFPVDKKKRIVRYLKMVSEVFEHENAEIVLQIR